MNSQAKGIMLRWIWAFCLNLAVVSVHAKTHFIHTDHLGTPLLMTGEQKQITWRATYLPFGRAAVDPVFIAELNLRFPGQYYDEESGLHYNYFRDYDPDTGRYIQSDPIGLAGGINTYAYAGNNPIKYSDPRGLDNVGCTTGALRINGRCELTCCAKHDKCYDDNGCTARSWISDEDCNSERCDACNKEVVRCFVWCDLAAPLGIEPSPGVPEYYCAAQHRYISIPGDFPSVDAARAVCAS